ncbi:flavonol sulfotransferase-like [Hibiscus syriacus]|uniref:flavonol sulfotransferase-like n=1 Tax=Hibiscus syriacus TaxID=106335 RepID=UPI001923549E|nr:flavonol sulfotransferase-like [Hibiscus syriacus]
MESTMDSKRSQSSRGEEEELISTLHKRQGLNSFNLNLVKYQGFWYADMSLVATTISAQRHFQAQRSDIFVCTAPKTGTTWLKALAFAIVSRTAVDGDSTADPFVSKSPHECLPALEYAETFAPFHRDPRNPLIATHVPFSSLPKSASDSSGCKIVYICRDPKDTFVSMYHFFAKLAASRNMEPVPLNKAFEFFCEGASSFGPYWDHVLGYWKASLYQPDRILFLKYEDMKENTAFHVRKLAEFIGYGFTLEEEGNRVVEKIVRMCSFDHLSNLEVNKNGKIAENTPWEMENKLYFRKGTVNDWENHLTPEMAAHMDLITEKKLSGSGLNLIYGKK